MLAGQIIVQQYSPTGAVSTASFRGLSTAGSLLGVRAFLSPCPGVNLSNRYGATRTCTGNAACASLLHSVQLDLVQEGGLDSGFASTTKPTSSDLPLPYPIPFHPLPDLPCPISPPALGVPALMGLPTSSSMHAWTLGSSMCQQNTCSVGTRGGSKEEGH